MDKTCYVIDTSVLVNDPNVLLALQNAEIIIPTIVIKEIDGIKKGQDEIGRNARYVSRFLDGLRKQGNLAEGVMLDNGNIVRIMAFGDIADSNDGHIIECAVRLHHERETVLLSKDTNVRIFADSLGVKAEDYSETAVDLDDLYKGWREVFWPADRISKFFNEKKAQTRLKLYPNEFLVIRDESGSSTSALARFDANNGILVPLEHTKDIISGIKPKNVEQKFALELLMDEDVRLITFVGRAGTGKTLLALAAGMDYVSKIYKSYNRLLVSRSVVPIGRDLGALPGDMNEKMMPWMQGVIDNLEFLAGGSEKFEKDGQDLGTYVENLFATGIVQIQPLTYIRGRSLPKMWLVIDEAQNLTPKEVKTIITRAGEGTKVILTGDIQQIDHPFLDQYNNGLSHVIDRFKGQKLFGHVTLSKTERSELADLASELL